MPVGGPSSPQAVVGRSSNDNEELVSQLQGVHLATSQEKSTTHGGSMESGRHSETPTRQTVLFSATQTKKLSWKPSTVNLDRYLLAEDIMYVFLCCYCGVGNILAYWNNCMYLT
ncbi:unnamed protein product [Lactuca virosa]|uniref:Uncharacterized protein n=1 Tax=Lactuca virosa TaxID=75947 RepID=A0AAU9LXJ6_9ASTR|nr:unnamed protein product [Lactuca virosa]